MQVAQYIYIAIAFISAFIITFLVLPYIIKYSLKKNLVDHPNFRKVHKQIIPRLGGIGIFVGFIGASLCWMSLFNNYGFVLLFLALLLVIIAGIVDDIKGISPYKKLFVQIIAAIIIIISGVKIESLYGLFGIYELPVALQYFFTILLVVGFTNAFNLIDGVDGLAGGIAFTNFIVFGIIFLYSDSTPYSISAFALAGSILAFLKYNFHPARIFMGDTGSMAIGFIIAIMGVKALQINSPIGLIQPHSPSILIIVACIMMIPAVDTLRVFIIRISNRVSPFTADMNHIHHLLLKAGYNPKLTSVILYISNIFIILLGYLINILFIN